MVDNSARNIYEQNNKLENQLSLWPFMSSKEQTKFLEEVRAFLNAAENAERSTTTKQLKSNFRIIIERWEEFLFAPKYKSARNLPIISHSDKTSPALPKFEEKEIPATDFSHSILSQLGGFLSQLFSLNKVDANSPPSIPHDPYYRAIYEEVNEVVDSSGFTK